jgi:hypothetical protein
VASFASFDEFRVALLLLCLRGVARRSLLLNRGCARMNDVRLCEFMRACARCLCASALHVHAHARVRAMRMREHSAAVRVRGRRWVEAMEREDLTQARYEAAVDVELRLATRQPRAEWGRSSHAIFMPAGSDERRGGQRFRRRRTTA